MPAISVVIPAFNAEATIAETVTSVLQQSWQDFELLVVNPSSSDRTRERLEQFTDARLKIIDAPRGNVSATRNRGLKLACGEFVTFLDADDLWTVDKLAAQLKALQNSPDASICYSFTDCIDEAGNHLYPANHDAWTGDVYAQLLLSNFVASGSNFMACREALTEVQGFDESLSNSADLDICLKLAVKHQFTVVRQVQILYRMVSKSQSTHSAGMLSSNLTILQRAYEHPKASHLQHLKPQSYANLYRFLSYKALQLPHCYGWVALKYWSRAIRSRPAFITTPDCYRILAKAFLAVSMSNSANLALRAWIRKATKTNADQAIAKPQLNIQKKSPAEP